VALVTALTERSSGRVAVELDGAPWRTLPAVAVVRAGLRQGVELDRPTARALRRELRRGEAIDRAARSLARRDLPQRAVDERLERAGFLASERAEAVGALERSGAIDDERFAHGRARALADRGWGDEAIRWQLERGGVDDATAVAAVEALEPEALRARELTGRLGATPAVARLLARRGFAGEVVEEAIAAAGGMEGGREVG
jgi:SOS response regulatory protein OraA/RecX